MTKRSYIRIVSYIGFVLAILIASVISSSTSAQGYKMQLEASYQQSLTELGECLDNISTDLTKSLYSNSYGEIYDLSRDLYAQCSTAKNAMSRLPIEQMKLNNTYKLLTQASDYAQYIGKRAEKGEAISKDEHNNLRKLLSLTEKFNQATNDMIGIVENGGMITQDEVRASKEINANALSISFENNNKTFDDFPTLLYDGPFSDQVLNKSSALVSSADKYTRKQCKRVAAKALGVGEDKLSYSGESAGKLPSYDFRYGKFIVSITKQGAFTKEILYSEAPTKSAMKDKAACSIATKYLEKIGYPNMRASYYNTSDNVCTINCVYESDGVLYYGDIIKVGVSLEDGDIVSLDCKTFLTNHIERNTQKPKLTKKQAREKVSKYLEIKSSRLAMIPKESGEEAFCYEFTCQSKDTGEEALVYINAKSGQEEDIMLLLKTDNGTLVK